MYRAVASPRRGKHDQKKHDQKKYDQKKYDQKQRGLTAAYDAPFPKERLSEDSSGGTPGTFNASSRRLSVR
jgi:hypothetical protein